MGWNAQVKLFLSCIGVPCHVPREMAMTKSLHLRKLSKPRSCILNFAPECTLYKNRITRIRVARDFQLINHFSQNISFARDIKTIAAIPAHVFEGGVGKVLESYAFEKNDLNSHHFVFFLNGDRSIGPNAFQKLVRSRSEEIWKVSKNLNVKNISVISGLFEKIKIGRIRGLMSDAIAMSALNVGLKDPLLISHDADQFFISKGSLLRIKRHFSRNKSLDVLGGRIYNSGYGPLGENFLPSKKLFPELILMDMAMTANKLISMKLLNPDLLLFRPSGAFSVFRLSSYCACNGYNYQLGHNEDEDIHLRLMHLRGHFLFNKRHQPFAIWDQNISVSVNPRRILQSILGKEIVPFTRTLGSNLDLKSLFRRYLKSEFLLQQSDLIKASRGQTEALNKTKESILRILLYEIRCHKLPNAQYIGIGKIFGVKIEKIHYSNGAPENLEVNWNRSPLLKKLLRWGLGKKCDFRFI
jgi:hypothetical protein